MEYRIGHEKKLISNLGPNFSEKHVQQVNQTVDVKEKLYLQGRLNHGVKIRSGKHTARSDVKDYNKLFAHLTETRAHLRIDGRTFGNFNLPSNILKDERFDNAGFYRWLVGKNKEAKSVIRAKLRK